MRRNNSTRTTSERGGRGKTVIFEISQISKGTARYRKKNINRFCESAVNTRGHYIQIFKLPKTNTT